ncbi:tRNA pseudouridine synthase D [Maioricimonas rarisocia]|uniref:tRNA pseudouridine synthase D n=1 Tax=Maioricimonas rarisocia TaxID=2528026 RepID=A0A517Z767_9PLAN|nr:tRNA pseudouridine(13) synthase TruD [Maioricimonas rarisocia]QDU38271.1 tRNA pseudouridine synthase D [Maioricimonas rarisocia]
MAESLADSVNGAVTYTTADLPGIGGVLKHEPEDFVVEEIPTYEPSGEGEHLFLWVEKQDVAAEQLVGYLSKALGVGRNSIGVAGLKDRRAVTRQYVSVPAGVEEKAAAGIDTHDIRVLKAVRHRNKLHTGHLQGNRFEIVVRNVSEDALARAQAIGEEVSRKGFPNRFGTQRFGRENETLKLGLALLQGKKSPHEIAPGRRKFLSRLALTAVQSALFNAVLDARAADGTLQTVLPGDVMQKVTSGGCFVSTEKDVDQARFDRREIVPTGPLFGVKMKPAGGEVAEREQQVLDRFELPAQQFAAVRRQLPGARRALLAWPKDLEIDEVPEGIRFRFALSSGVYATAMLREFMKSEATDDGS